MPGPTSLLDPAVKGLTVGLISYLQEYLKSFHDQIRDGIADTDVFWLASARPYLSPVGLDIPCPPSAGAPGPPAEVRRWLVDEDAWRHADGPTPQISTSASDKAYAQYDQWFPGWRRWADEEQTN